MSKCEILAVVIDNSVFGCGPDGNRLLANGDWVTLVARNDWKDRKPSYRSKLSRTWGVLGRNYRPIINLETGELYD